MSIYVVILVAFPASRYSIPKAHIRIFAYFPLSQPFFWHFASQTLLVYGLPVSQSVMIQQMLKGYSQVNLQLN